MRSVKNYSEITHAEWILFYWIDITEFGAKEAKYLKGRPRPLDEAMKLSGGSIETLKPYLWALNMSYDPLAFGANEVDQ